MIRTSGTTDLALPGVPAPARAGFALARVAAAATLPVRKVEQPDNNPPARAAFEMTGCVRKIDTHSGGHRAPVFVVGGVSWLVLTAVGAAATHGTVPAVLDAGVAAIIAGAITAAFAADRRRGAGA